MSLNVTPVDWNLETAIRDWSEHAIIDNHGDIQAAAKALGVGKMTLYRWVARWKQDDATATTIATTTAPAHDSKEDSK